MKDINPGVQDLGIPTLLKFLELEDVVLRHYKFHPASPKNGGNICLLYDCLAKSSQWVVSISISRYDLSINLSFITNVTGIPPVDSSY